MLDRYRILQSNRDRFKVQQRFLVFFWSDVGKYGDLEGAEAAVKMYQEFDEKRRQKRKEKWRRCC